MVKLDKIYTKTGDGGTTRLATGEPVSKWNPRVNTYGTVDELNAILGLCNYEANAKGSEPGDPFLHAALTRIQNDLFDLGADIATPETDRDLGYEPLRILTAQVDRLEAEIDKMNEKIAPLDSFVLPGGSILSAQLHHARTVARRAERQMVALNEMEDETISEAALCFINRLSDWLFVAARRANANGIGDVKWVPGANR